MLDRYEPKEFESKWRQKWTETDLFKTRVDADRPKFYGMDFFPYPSGAGLSVGHCRNYIPTDVLCRMKFMQGYNVLHPMGFDAFGLPAENEAIKRKSHPAPMIDKYADNYRRQIDMVGISYDWSRSFKSSDADYYKWTQWIFSILYKRGLAYRKLAAVNWDPVDKTVLADEEVIGGRAERSGAVVEKKWIAQWFFKITDYAQRLLDDLDTLDWPEGIKAMQRNWIGRSEGVQFSMRVAGTGEREGKRLDLDSEDAGSSDKARYFDVFTTRIDTIFGMTFCVLAPEHALVDLLPVNEEDRARIKAYQEEAKALSDADRTATTREKSGVFTGAYAINPATGGKVPIWIADYVLATYGTGAIMAVPGHDQRDFDFAIKFGLDVIPVIQPTPEYLKEQGATLDEYLADVKRFTTVFESKDSVLVNSGEYSGQPVSQAQQALGEWVEALGIGERKIQYKLRDWLISRQRYWGCPIPVIHSAEGEEQLVPDSDLPVELPWVENYEPSDDGSSPLARIESFVNVTDRDGRLGRRETDTMGGFACSSWYFLRFCDPHNPNQGWSPDAVKYWMPVDCYVGGAEHAVMHLLYARFWTKVLFDEGLVPVKEPFKRLLNQGQVLANTPYRKPREGERLGVGEDGILCSFEEAKTLPESDLTWKWVRMSKSKGNVVTPDEAVELCGADALRMYLLFVAPFNADVQWQNEGMQGQVRFLSRIFKWVNRIVSSDAYLLNWCSILNSATTALPETIGSKEPIAEAEEYTYLLLRDPKAGGRPGGEERILKTRLRRATHTAIKNCTEDIERFSFNTYVSSLMKFVNELNDITKDLELVKLSYKTKACLSEAAETLVLLLSPGAPHSADELWTALGKEGVTYHAEWPKFDAELVKADLVTVAVQVNGKLRDTLKVAAGSTDAQLQEFALSSDRVKTFTDGKTIRKVIVVQGKLVNVVVSD